MRFQNYYQSIALPALYFNDQFFKIKYYIELAILLIQMFFNDKNADFKEYKFFIINPKTPKPRDVLTKLI